MQETQTTQSARVMFTNQPLLRDYFGSLGQVLVATAIVERFGKESMYGLSIRTKNTGHCREVTIVKRWLLVELQLYLVTAMKDHVR